MSSTSLVSNDFSIVAPRVSGSISAVSSALIIFIIFQSRSKLSRIYHRIMFGMSCVDILSSVAMGLTTLPMPPASEEELPRYIHGGTKIGNVHTCAAQGFLFQFGIFAMFFYNLSLCIYNTCFIVFRMEERTILKYVEPFLHIIPLVTGLTLAILPLITNSYAPTRTTMWCTVDSQSDNEGLKFYFIFLAVLAITFFSLIVLCGLAMITRVYYIEQNLSLASRSAANDVRVARSLKNTKVLICQVLAYVLSYLATLIFPTIYSVIPGSVHGSMIFFLANSLLPLQGFFNALIFIYHKIYNYRRVHDDVSRCYVLKLLLVGDSEEIMLFSRISMIHHHQRRRVMEVELGDESGNVERISLDEDNNKPPSVADVFYDDINIEQNLSGFSQSPTKKPQALDGADSILSSTSSSKKNEDCLHGDDSSERNEDSWDGDSILSLSKESSGILSWLSRISDSGISLAPSSAKG